jgi:hypothetical protein
MKLIWNWKIEIELIFLKLINKKWNWFEIEKLKLIIDYEIDK